MNERIPTGSRFFDVDGAGWVWADAELPQPSWPTESEDWHDEPVDYDSVPTLAELEAGATGGPVVSLLDEPHAIALPEIYEPGYAYPLIVWFHEAGGSEEDIFTLLPDISERNYLAMAIRGGRTTGAGAEWSTAELGAGALVDKLQGAIARLSEKFTIHPDRVFLAGMGTGGTTAVELLLERPEAFAGAASINGPFPQLTQPLARFRGLRGRRVLLSTTMDNPDVKVVDMVAAGRLLYSAGMLVGTRIYQPSGGRPTPKMLRDIDHWIMDGISSAVRVS
jgi:phospholipase/carboxylesterase